MWMKKAAGMLRLIPPMPKDQAPKAISWNIRASRAPKAAILATLRQMGTPLATWYQSLRNAALFQCSSCRGAQMAKEDSESIAILRHYVAKIAAALVALPLFVSCANREPDHAGGRAHVSDTRMTPALVPFPAHLAMQSGQFVVDDRTPLIFDG